ncbi:MAG: VOC family protein [Rhodobacteraceae bacterium]|nr:VOC family protein [Paracoccaceae bacterium]
MKRPSLQSLDHLVLSVADIDATTAFYHDALGMEALDFPAADGTCRRALGFGAQKINLHAADAPFLPHARHPKPGSADLCFLSKVPLSDWIQHLTTLGIVIESGPVARSGARGPITSIYLRDPDGNLIEISNQVSG